MSRPNVTTDEAAGCLSLLETAARPQTAAELAQKMKLAGSRETQRRHVRAIVRHLRDNCGAQIVATLAGGYWLTDDEQLWSDYLKGRQIDAKRILGRTHEQKRMLVDDRGQGHLFDMRTRCGVASCGVN